MKNNLKNYSFTPLQSTLLACRIIIVYILLFGFILNILMLAAPIYSMQVLDRVLSSGNINTLIGLTIVIILAFILTAGIQGARSFALNRMGIWFEKQMSELLFRNSVKMSSTIKGSANSQQLRDLQIIKSFIISQSVIIIMDLPWSLIFLLTLFFLHTYIGFLALFGGIILITIGIISDKINSKIIQKNNENFLKSMSYVEESNHNAEVIEAMAMMPNIINSWQKLNNIVHETQSYSNESQIIFSEIIKVIRSILQIAVTGLGAYLTVQGEFSSGAIIASSTLMSKALGPFEIAINTWKKFVNCRQSYERINMLCKEYDTDKLLIDLREIKGDIRLENISITNQNSGHYILQNIDFYLNSGNILVIIGESGSGKTSLAKLLVGISSPTSGIIRIDGINLKDIKKSSFGNNIGYLPQNVELFSGTILQNIARMCENPNYDEVIYAAKMAGAHDMILGLPNGYNTNIGFAGSSLSGGQKQRIGLARAFYKNPKILILDEPNASLDAHGDKALINAIQYAKTKNITVIVISHRNTILSVADKIAIIHKGNLVIFGDKDEVIKKMQESNNILISTALEKK
ncbi:type I secretion system permease/ATPase [Lyticum sinuosum]|uniref:AprD family type I secretion system permease/ATPase n=1 Tax=Lyticum sinuosum TaxID=1332059 RepID=A0AAE4VMJ1_9RICK|nr:type I secretion system permease/ATPase [Lyticum sinuosum]MDZ5761604.1 putative AprD family type I secretion system permease/ATPase [Lyticum sinuosum]